MRALTLSLIATAGLGVTGGLPALTVDEVVEKHIAARGGHAAWQGVGDLRMTGSFTGFSQVNPFTLHRTQDGHYHLDHVLGDKVVVIGWDGETAWWENNWMEPGARRISGPDLAVAMRDVEFPLTPFFDLDTAGHQVALAGESTIDGMKVVGVDLTRKDGSNETWYFDPDTFLEVARDSPGSDFGRPMTQRTIFDGFDQVGDAGAVMPHYVESQWYTRHRVMDIERVETGVAVDRNLFAMPAPLGMEPLLALVGSWSVKAETRPQPGAEWSTSERASTITAELARGMVRERLQGQEAVWERSFTYDRFRKDYVVTVINDQTPYLDIMRGALADGVITVSNQATGTTRDLVGRVIHGRLTIKEVGDDGFVIEHASSIDAGESWFQDARLTYSRTGG